MGKTGRFFKAAGRLSRNTYNAIRSSRYEEPTIRDFFTRRGLKKYASTALATGALLGALQSYDHTVSDLATEFYDTITEAIVETYDGAVDRLTGRETTAPSTKPVNPARKWRIDDGYSREEVRYLEGLIQQRQGRIIELGKSGQIPLKGMLRTVESYENKIREEAKSRGVPEHVALGITGLENGGGTNKGKGCCKGIMQVGWNVGVKYGAIKCKGGKLTQTKRSRYICKGGKWNDQRNNPELNIEAGVHFLSDLYDEEFQDWGFATQGYHAGEVNVKRGIAKFIDYKHRGDRGHKKTNWRRVNPTVIEREGATWIKVMQDGPALAYFKGLKDESYLYLPKSLAMWRMYLHRDEVLADPAIH